MSQLLVLTESQVTPAECLASTAYMLEAVGKGRTQGAPLLKIARPRGEAVVLGRYQRPSSALKLDVCEARGLPRLRRLTGGTAVMLGEGKLHLSLVIPDRNHPLECEPRQFLQRYGAGAIRALTQMGLKARYFGKDLISIEDRPLGLMSFELTPDGLALLEVILGVQSAWLPDPVLGGYPARSKEETPSAPATRLRDELTGSALDTIDERLAESFADLLSLDPEPRTWTPLEVTRIRSLEHRVEIARETDERCPPYMRAWDSRPVEEAIGFVEASVRLAQGRFLRDIWIHGDFMADSGGIEDLQEKLRMVPVKRRPVALVIDDVLGAPEHVIMGIRRLGSVLEAILDASRRATEEGATGKKKG